MSSWTTRQIEILMDWVEENNECSEKSIWAKRYYDLLYLIIYIPSIIITAYLSSTPDASYVAPVIINQAITTLDKFFNFGKLASEYEGYSNLYQNFSDRILEELVKPESVKQNGSIFYHDMNWEKQRLGDKTKPIPWVVEKIYNHYKNKKKLSHSNGGNDYDDESTNSNTSSSSHGIIYTQPAESAGAATGATVLARSQSNKLYTRKHNDAALVIQNAWYNWCVRHNKTNLISTMHNKRIIPKLVKRIIIDRHNNNQNKKLRRSQSIAIPSASSCNLLLPNPQTKMQKKLAKMIHESINENAQPQRPLANQLSRFNENFADTPTYDDFIEIVVAEQRNKRQGNNNVYAIP
jgi:hypothetical protein